MVKPVATRPEITAFANSPDGGRGLARDMRVRWALEEVGQDYTVRYVPMADLKLADYRHLQPFGQVPAFCDGDLVLFESGAIVLHLAQTRPGLLPKDPGARARAVAWLFAAVSTIEQPVVELEQAHVTEQAEAWYAARLPRLEANVRQRLAALAARLDQNEWLDGAFSAGDLMMVMVLYRLTDSLGVLPEFPTLSAYVERGQARPAYQRAFAAQKAAFDAHHQG